MAGSGGLIAECLSVSDLSYQMLSLGYVSQDMAVSGLYWSTACKFMVMFLEFAQQQNHCCLCWHQSLTSCRCSWASGSQLYPSRLSGDQSSPSVTTWMSLLLFYTSNWTWPSQCFALSKKKKVSISFAAWCFKYCTSLYDMTAVLISNNSWFIILFSRKSWSWVWAMIFSILLEIKVSVLYFKTRFNPLSAKL